MSQTSRATQGIPEPPARGRSARLTNLGDRLGVGVLAVMFLAGLWLMAAPFIVGYQGRSTKWTAGTINIFSVGAGVALLALATIIVFVAGVLFGLARNSRQDGERPDEPRAADPAS